MSTSIIYLDLLKDSRAFRTDFELSNSVYKNLVENKDNNSGIEISNDQKKLLKDSFSSAASIISIIDTSIALTNEKGIEMAKFLGEEVFILNDLFYYLIYY